jgi:hypothetical protein
VQGGGGRAGDYNQSQDYQQQSNPYNAGEMPLSPPTESSAGYMDGGYMDGPAHIQLDGGFRPIDQSLPYMDPNIGFNGHQDPSGVISHPHASPQMMYIEGGATNSRGGTVYYNTEPLHPVDDYDMVGGSMPNEMSLPYDLPVSASTPSAVYAPPSSTVYYTPVSAMTPNSVSAPLGMTPSGLMGTLSGSLSGYHAYSKPYSLPSQAGANNRWTAPSQHSSPSQHPSPVVVVSAKEQGTMDAASVSSGSPATPSKEPYQASNDSLPGSITLPSSISSSRDMVNSPVSPTTQAMLDAKAKSFSPSAVAKEQF